MAIKTLEEALEYIEFLGSIADICVKRQTGKICKGCNCKFKPTPSQKNEGNATRIEGEE